MGILKLQSSLLVTILAGTGLLAVLYVTPVKNSYPETDTSAYSTIPEGNPEEETSGDNAVFSSSGEQKEPPMLRIPVSRRRGYIPDSYSETIPSISKSWTGVMITQSGTVPGVTTGRHTDRTWLNDTFQREMFRGRDYSYTIPDYLSWKYSLSRDFSFLVHSEKTGAQTGISGSGISVEEGKFSASVMALTPTYFTMDNQAKKSNQGSAIAPIAWEMALKPTRNLQLSTGIIDGQQRNGTNLDINAARVGMALSLEKIVLNLRYSYSTVDNIYNYGDFRRNWNMLGVSPGKTGDSTSLGVTIFLDTQKRYSVYIGNQFYNTMFFQPGSSNRSMMPSVSASFRGKATEKVNYFFNFQNQPYKDYYYLNYGLYRLPVASQSSIDFATALGMEQSF